MKKTIIASLAVLASAAVLATFALGGTGKFGGIQVHADPVEHSVTFDGSESTTTQGIGGNYAICTTTAAGNKVGVVGYDNSGENFTFNGFSFTNLCLFDIEGVLTERAYQFSTITGLAISFSGEEVVVDFDSKDRQIFGIESGKEYKGLSIASGHHPVFSTMIGSVTVTSLTIWYSC